MVLTMVINFGYAFLGGLMAIFLMMVGYKIFDFITPFDTAKEIDSSNQAVGNIVAGIFIGVGLSIGLVIGLALN